ncbi:MAG: hypothetical protein M1820_002133 [Bogoriella megaspora]|nr:MAG: hypothetical protein M1820_002133 [Bogoriella megaspora]
MAQKAAKTLAARNTSILNRTLLLTLGFHGIFLLLRFLLLKRSLIRYLLLSSPALIIQFWFERIGRPTHGVNGELKRSGEDLEAKGLTEWMWDVLYWTYGCLLFVILLGDSAWWLYVSKRLLCATLLESLPIIVLRQAELSIPQIVVPLYSAWLAWTTFGSARQGLAGLTGGGADGQVENSGSSKRQQKLEKRGGQRIQYR